MLDKSQVVSGYRARCRHDPGVTLVAHYGARQAAFREAIGPVHDRLLRLQKSLADMGLKDTLSVHPLAQCHATLCGLEAEIRIHQARQACFSVNLLERHRRFPQLGETPPMDLAALVRYCANLPLPMKIRIGGFSATDVNPFSKSNPYERSFSIQPNGLLTLMGWPVQEMTGAILPTLMGARLGFEQYGHVCHKYHVTPGSYDNDCFVVLASVTPKILALSDDRYGRFLQMLQETCTEIREYLSKNPRTVPLAAEHCAVVRYRSTNLVDPDRNEIVPLRDLTVERLRRLYFGTPFVDNPKLLIPEPRWAAFRGFSLLFDPADDSLTPPDPNGLRTLACPAGAGLYDALEAALQEFLDELTGRYGFCPLPPASFHVTGWDGINESNLDRLSKPARARFGRYLHGLPDSLREPLPLEGLPAALDLAHRIRFRFRDLAILGHQALVARLAPADEPSMESLQIIEDRRHKLDQTWAEACGKPRNPDYTPHVSLGYFANSALAREAAAPTARWSTAMAQKTGDLTVAFDAVSLYAFTDMATYFTRQ